MKDHGSQNHIRLARDICSKSGSKPILLSRLALPEEAAELERQLEKLSEFDFGDEVEFGTFVISLTNEIDGKISPYKPFAVVTSSRSDALRTALCLQPVYVSWRYSDRRGGILISIVAAPASGDYSVEKTTKPTYMDFIEFIASRRVATPDQVREHVGEEYDDERYEVELFGDESKTTPVLLDTHTDDMIVFGPNGDYLDNVYDSIQLAAYYRYLYDIGEMYDDDLKDAFKNPLKYRLA